MEMILYSDVLRVNLTSDCFEVIKCSQEGMLKAGSREKGMEKRFMQFAEEGGIYRRDVKRFLEFTKISYLSNELKNGKKIQACTYRCRCGTGYRWHTMEVIPDYDYSPENQTVRLYVKDIHDLYRDSLNWEEINIRSQEIIQSLGEVNYGIYVVDLFTGIMYPVRIPADLEESEDEEYLEWDQVLEKSVQNRFHPQYEKKILDLYSLKALRKAWEEGERKKEILCQRMFEDGYHYVSVTAYLHADGEDRGLAVLAFQDVDEVTRKEINRNRNLMRLATVIRSGYHIMNTVDLETGMCERIYLKEEDADKLCTGSYEKAISNAAENSVHEDDREKFWSVFSLENLRKKAEKVEKFEEVTCQYRIKSSPVTWVEEHIFFVRQAETVMVNILGRDITKQKMVETTAALEKRERNYIINAMSSLFFAAYYIDLEASTFRKITEVKEVGDVLGAELNCEEGFRKYAEHFIHPDDRRGYLEKMDCKKMRDSLSGEQPFMAMEYRKIKEENGVFSGEYDWIRATVVLADSRDGKAKKALYIAQDVTESKQKEEQEIRMLQEACDAANHANASKSEFLSRMSHDIRTPMNAIIGMTSIAGAHLDDPERVSDCLNKITVSSKHLLSLINEVLDMSKIESGKINLVEEEFSLSELIENLLTILRPSVEAKRHKMEFHIRDVEHVEVIGDAMRLQQVLINILGNSVKYTKEGGCLQLELTEKKSSMAGYGCYEFVISDNGMGMTPEYVKKIFEPFSRAEDSRISKIEGTGLGMAIALNIARKMSGDIHVESRVNEGSRFTVTVYLKQQNAKMAGTKMPDDERDSHTEEEEPDFSGSRILLVEDNEINREIAVEVLNSFGVTVEIAEDGKQAVDKYREMGAGYYDLVFMDVQMPVMNGYEATQAIRNSGQEDAGEIPIVAMTANAFAEDVTASRKAGMSEHITKPLDIGQLKKCMGRFLGKKRNTGKQNG